MAAGSTYTPIATTTLGSNASSITFSSISGSYTDLILVGTFATVSGGDNVGIQVGNGSADTGTNYSFTNLYGDGSTASSTRSSNNSAIYVDYGAYPATTIKTVDIIHFQNYSNTTTYKTLIARSNTASLGVDATVGLWRSTSAINTIKILAGVGGTFITGCTATLYGITAA